jgi:signal transduction histidine kinase
MKATGEHALSVLRRYRQVADMSSKEPDLIDKVMSTQIPELHVLPAFMDEAKLLEQEEENFQRRSIEGASRQQVKSALVFGVCLNIAITILIAVLFSRQITSRLMVIAENTRLFGERKPMKPLVGGQDEIAQVDSALHNMAENLIKSEEVKQEFVSMITHDLRSPLAALQSTLAVALKGTYGELNETGANRLHRAEKSLERLILLINELLDLDKLEAGGLQMKISAVPIQPLLEEAAAIVKALAEEKMVKVEIESGKQIVAADRERLLQVVVNLLGNAIKFAPHGSDVRLNTRSLEGFVEVRVIDHGPGIKWEDQPAIFERFKQLSQNSGQPGGTGLGLAICRALVLAQGGKIGVESEEHQGSQFWVLMPTSMPTA